MSPLGWLFLGVGGWAAYALWDEYCQPAGGDGKGGFWDYVKKPGSRGRRTEPPGKAFPLPEDDSPAAWDACLRQAIAQKWDTFEYTRLADRSAQVAPAAARLMQDTSFVGQAWPTKENDLPHWNLSALKPLLGKIVPIEVLAPVEPFLVHENEWCRKSAAEIVGRIDDGRAAETQRRCITSDDRRIRDGVFHGMVTTAYERTGCRELVLSLWPDLCRALATEKINYSSIPTIIRRLAEADPERAQSDLHGDSILRWDHRNINNILDGLREAKIPPARGLILQISDHWKMAEPSEWRSAFHRGQVLGACLLILLPDKPMEADPEIRALVMALLEDASPETRRAACPAFLRLHGLTTDPGQICHSILYDRKGLLSHPQRAYWEVQRLFYEVQNGGWHQYFVNSSGNGWMHCLAGAAEMGLHHLVADMQRAAALFGPDGPDVNRERRWQRLSQFTKHQDKTLEALGFDGDAVEVALAKYAVQHREEFLPSVLS